MAKDNPIAGGPDYIEILFAAIEKRTSAYSRPPATGGVQFSLRLPEERMLLLEELRKRSGWNRNQIVNALIDKGLLMLFAKLSDKTADEIMTEVAEKLINT